MRHRARSSQTASNNSIPWVKEWYQTSTKEYSTHSSGTIISAPITKSHESEIWDQANNGNSSAANHAASSDSNIKGFRVKRSNSRFLPHPCRHVTVNYAFFEGDVNSFVFWDKTFAGWWIRQIFRGFPSFLAGAAGGSANSSIYKVGATAPPRTNWSDVLPRFDHLRSSFMDNKSLIGETLAEPGLIIQTMQGVLSPGRFFSNLAQHFGKRYRKKTVGQISRLAIKDSASYNLLYQFGVAPLIQEWNNAAAAHSLIAKRMSYLKDRRGKFIPLRARTLINKEESNQSIQQLPGTYLSLRRIQDSSYGMLSASCWGRVSSSSSLDDVWRYYFDYFGIGSVAQLAWELVPYSFVLDWVSNAQERISRLASIGVGNPYTEFSAPIYSSKLTVEDGIYLVGDTLPGTSFVIESDGSPIRVGSITTSTYDRSLIRPDEFLSVTDSEWNSFKSFLGGSLLLQKL